MDCEALIERLDGYGWRPTAVPGVSALARRDELPPGGDAVRAIVLAGESLPRSEIGEQITTLRRRWPLVDIVMWHPAAPGPVVRDALRAGARDVVLTSSAAGCAHRIDAILRAQQIFPHATNSSGDLSGAREFAGMLSRSRRMWDLFKTLERVAPTEATVLILGETGTGKELLARALHRMSGRTGSFVAVDCGAVPQSLIDSELFGHEKGAFTGAASPKEGLFRYANGGTLFLDELGNLPLTAQHRLLRVLQEGAVRPVGAHKEIEVDVRVVAATGPKLEAKVTQGTFRADLFYRLDVIRLEVPPLRERREDILFLFASFASRLAETYNVERPRLTNEFAEALVNYEWPGNVRQLENLAERLVLTRSGQLLSDGALEGLLPFEERAAAASAPASPGLWADAAPDGLDIDVPLAEALQPHLERLERAYLQACLAKTGGRMGEAAERAGVNRRTLLRKLKRHGIDRRDYRNGER